MKHILILCIYVEIQTKNKNMNKPANKTSKKSVKKFNQYKIRVPNELSR